MSMEVKILKPSELIRNYLLNDLAQYDNGECLSPSFVIKCQEIIKNRIMGMKENNYEAYEMVISFLYLEYLKLQKLEQQLPEKRLSLNLDNPTLNDLLEIIDYDNTVLDILILAMIVIYGVEKNQVKIKFNQEEEKKWNPFYTLEEMTYESQNSDYEAFKSIIYTCFNEKGPSAALREIEEGKRVFPLFYQKFIVEVLKNFFICDFVTCKNNRLLRELKEAILRKDNLVSFYENLDFVSQMNILLVYLQFAYKYDEVNMQIRKIFAQEEEYAKPFIKALTLEV